MTGMPTSISLLLVLLMIDFYGEKDGQMSVRDCLISIELVLRYVL
jgi:hypothetical protein